MKLRTFKNWTREASRNNFRELCRRWLVTRGGDDDSRLAACGSQIEAMEEAACGGDDSQRHFDRRR